MAADLGLPIPEPYLVEIPPGFAGIVPDAARQQRIRTSSSVAFGSTFITPQYSTWLAGTKITDSLLPTALAIFTFDAIIQNVDRRVGNANCIVRNDSCLIFDHELCFMHDKIFLWKPPWKLDGLDGLKTSGHHIFSAELRDRPLDFSDVRRRRMALSDTRLLTYANALPPEWADASVSVQASLNLIRDARDNIDGCIKEIERVLT